MEENLKQLLLKDLCARLLDGVIVHVRFYDIQNDDKLKERDITLSDGCIGFIFRDSHWVECKPYLRPMSSMTEEEKTIYEDLIYCDGYTKFDTYDKVVDWLNAHYFDYRGLIEKGLALEAPNNMYNLNKE